MPEKAMKNVMLCQIIEGEIWINQDGKEYTAKVGHVYSCVVGTMEMDRNDGSVPAIMRVINLFAA